MNLGKYQLGFLPQIEKEKKNLPLLNRGGWGAELIQMAVVYSVILLEV